MITLMQKTWKVVSLGQESMEHGRVHKALEKANIGLCGLAPELIQKAPKSQTGRFEVVKIPVEDIASSGDHRIILLGLAPQLGLLPCPAWLSPKLRRQYLNQPGTEILWPVMEPIECGDKAFGFSLHNHNGAGPQLGSYRFDVAVGDGGGKKIFVAYVKPISIATNK